MNVNLKTYIYENIYYVDVEMMERLGYAHTTVFCTFWTDISAKWAGAGLCLL